MRHLAYLFRAAFMAAVLFGIMVISLQAKEMMSTSHLAPPPPSGKSDLKKLKLPFSLKPSKMSLDSIKIQDVKTSGGSSIWLVENQDIPVVTFQVMFKDAGSKNETKGKFGLVNILAAMLDEGAGDYDSQGFKKFLIENNIDLFVNQSNDTFIIGFSVPKMAVKQAFEAIKLILTSLRLDAAEMAKIKSHLHVSYKQELENEGQKASDELSQILAPNHPYATTVKNRLDNLENIGSDDIREFMENNFTKDRLLLSACGSISGAELSTLIDDTFKELPEKTKAKDVPDVVLQGLGSTHHATMDIPQTIILFAHPGFKRKDPDYFAFDLALNVFGSGELRSRLMLRIREEKGLVYGINTSHVSNRHAQLILGHASTRTQTVNQVMGLVRDEWKKFIEKGITADELAREKQRSIGEFPLRVANTHGITSTLIAIQYNNLGIDYLARRTKEIDSVNLEHVNALLKERFKENWLTFVTVGKDQAGSKEQTGGKEELDIDARTKAESIKLDVVQKETDKIASAKTGESKVKKDRKS